ncbi:hypothetical protein Cs7R123_44690 [Catellatospora sp. TT07R-123]|uniref:hypothetical protein n=1 Tax=Catellatospora sp. TT07R-123 TaxID=2733863 RepID=UPI001B1C3DE4|nr:hypothetical protein [Catellatospora sp. TT07R-123]GHJ47127.1 hypothetical protein Cs7R123_44690 [Catellatospora sp. TT07R-123]
MHDLTHRMRAAVDAPPPSGIDLDSLIAAEQRRSRRLRWAGSATGTAALVAAVLTLPLLVSGGGRAPVATATGCPTPAPAAVSTATGAVGPLPGGCAQTVTRLAAAVRGSLAALAPQAQITAHDPTAFVYNRRFAQYEALFDLALPDVRGFVAVEAGRAPQVAPTRNDQCDGATPISTACGYQRTADGAVLLSVADWGFNRAHAYLPDGTMVSAYSYVDAVHSGSPPLTVRQLLELVQADGLGVFPDGPVAPSPAPDRAREQLSAQLATFLRARLPDARIDVPQMQGSPTVGFRTRVDLGAYGRLAVSFTPACAYGACPSPPVCLGNRNGTCGLGGFSQQGAGGTAETVRLLRLDDAVVEISTDGPVHAELAGRGVIDLAEALHY